MNVLLIDNETKLLEKLERLIPGTLIVKKWNDPTLLDLLGIDFVILSGSSAWPVQGNTVRLLKETELVRNSKLPIIGICFGCELIAYTFGGTLQELTEEHKGIREIKIVDKSFSDKEKISVYECHKMIIKEMPKDFIILARSEQGPEAIRHVTKPIFGLQFHPENFVDQAEGDEVFLKLIKKLSTLSGA